MNDVDDIFDDVIDVRIEMQAGLQSETTALDDVEEMRDHAGFDETLAVLVEVNSPGIAGAFAEQLEDFFGGMIAPDASIDVRALAIRRAGLSDVGVGEHAVATVKPAVRTPGESVESFVGVL